MPTPSWFLCNCVKNNIPGFFVQEKNPNAILCYLGSCCRRCANSSYNSNLRGRLPFPPFHEEEWVTNLKDAWKKLLVCVCKKGKSTHTACSILIFSSRTNSHDQSMSRNWKSTETSRLVETSQSARHDLSRMAAPE